GTGGIPIGGAFRVVTTSLVPITGQFKAGGQTVGVPAPPTEVTVTFSGNVNPNAIHATDLVLSGTALDPTNPAHATRLTWIDAHTVEFNPTGKIKPSETINVSLAQGSIKSPQGKALAGSSDSAVLTSRPPPPPVTTPPTGGGSTGSGTGSGSGSGS